MTNTQIAGGIIGTICTTLIALRADGVIHWAWYWIMFPIWGCYAFAGICYLFLGIMSVKETHRKRKVWY